MAQFEIVQNDTQPILQATLYTGTGAIQDLTGATVTFKMKDRNDNTIINEAACTIVGAPSLGVVQYQWLLADTAAVDSYYGEFHVTLAGGGKITFPTAGPFVIQVRKRLG